jgi:hypothetical protein
MIFTGMVLAFGMNKKSMKILLVIILMMSLTNCDNKDRLHDEIQNPLSFLTIKNNTWNEESVISGMLTNRATKADYSNIVILVHYFSDTGTNLGTERVSDYYILKAGESRDYNLDIHPASLTDSIAVTIERASYVDYNEKGKFE